MRVRQMPGWNWNVHSGQITPQPVPGMSSQEMSTDGNEQRRSVILDVTYQSVIWLVFYPYFRGVLCR